MAQFEIKLEEYEIVEERDLSYMIKFPYWQSAGVKAIAKILIPKRAFDNGVIPQDVFISMLMRHNNYIKKKNPGAAGYDIMQVTKTAGKIVSPALSKENVMRNFEKVGIYQFKKYRAEHNTFSIQDYLDFGDQQVPADVQIGFIYNRYGDGVHDADLMSKNEYGMLKPKAQEYYMWKVGKFRPFRVAKVPAELTAQMGMAESELRHTIRRILLQNK